MPNSLSLSTPVQVFPCPNCGQTINTSHLACPFCHAPIDPVAAEQAARLTSKISRACNDASYLRIVLGTLILFAVVTIIPFLGFVGLFGSVFVKYLTGVLAIRWWFLYGRLRTADPDFARARTTTIVVSCISLLVLFLYHIRIGALSL